MRRVRSVLGLLAETGKWINPQYIQRSSLLDLTSHSGHLKPDTYFNVPRYSRLYGAKAAAEIVKFETSQVLAVKDLVERENLDCDFQLTRGVDVYLNEVFANRTADAYLKLAKEGLIDVRDVAYTGPEYAEQVSLL